MQKLDLDGHHRVTLEGIFRHPINRNPEWHDVSSLLSRVGTITERHSGAFDVRVGTQRAVITRPAGKDLDADELKRLQGFLRSAGLDSADAVARSSETMEDVGELDCVVLIDHAHARLFLLHSDEPASAPFVLAPSNAHGFHRHI